MIPLLWIKIVPKAIIEEGDTQKFKAKEAVEYCEKAHFSGVVFFTLFLSHKVYIFYAILSPVPA